MERYEGLGSRDSIIGGGAYVKKEGHGLEVCNFRKHRNKLYGYVQVPGEEIDIERIGAKPEDDSISRVTVIWTATRPTGGTAVVGWYKDATVYRSYQQFKHTPAAHRRNRLDGYWIEVDADRATLLPIDERTCEIPRRQKGGMGQSNIWYADNPLSGPIVTEVMRLVNGAKPRPAAQRNGKRKQDQERKSQIEKAAIRMCWEHFEHLGYNLRSVEKDNVGWDLVAQSGRSTLHIEVKGLSGNVFSVELTPNEYHAFSEKSAAYRLAVIIKSLDNPTLFICRFSRELDAWVVDGHEGRLLEIQPKESACIRSS
ncbi:MAG TPA: DUF3883 domain-containing protein [Gammaproteobacteria bacterium]|nr:DUF3883 domain-containing protein [Gammaproteobacteria bacterium]